MHTEPLYRQLASHYLHAIQAGTLRPGERMPSVRVLMQRHDVSLSTALQVCRHLESRGVLEARPRSGYFVRPQARAGLAPASEPVAALPDPARYVGIHQRVSDIVARGQAATVHTNLSGASGAPGLYPTEPLKNAAIRALRQHPDLFGQGVPTLGVPEFRAVIAKRALAARMNLSADEVLITQGCIEALNLALRAVAQPGDVIAVESPGFYGLLQVLESLGMRALEIPTSPQTGISLEALELAAQTYDRIAGVVVVPNLQNPLGAVMPEAHKERLVRWCAAQGIALIEDDTYSGTHNDEAPLSALKSWDRDGGVIHCASLHKTLAPGMRLGWISAGRWHARVEMLKFTQSRPNEALSQLAVADFMASGAYDRHLRRLRVMLRDQREQLAEAIATCFPAGTRLSVPNGGLGLWIEMPQGCSSATVFDAALREGIRIAPGLMFSNSNRFDGFIRLSCGFPYTRALDQALRRLADVVRRAG
ncbi:aminotransferase-like domain-containing protein [Chitiniphilus eburneus]|uniref:Putative 8-amino-7-oxononanoate synthase n=1 Tax=Chitiniphilus eburneus TaxID=2571148 RepID=A0A4U0PWU0_9NEIS|nr:PLP-dependent aminotransferase family protein [Chitiniphilus eburneus]TJZ72987.1 PLP-dependent aminotransferase family protein [Chitiniphilus eburneus]